MSYEAEPASAQAGCRWCATGMVACEVEGNTCPSSGCWRPLVLSADKLVKQELAFGFKDFGCLFNGENFTFPGEW